jgi:hypothetical protein
MRGISESSFTENDGSAEQIAPAPSFAARIRPFAAAVCFLLFFVAASGVFLSYPMALAGRVDFRHLYSAGYMVRAGQAAELYDHQKNIEVQNCVVGPAEGDLTFNHLAYESLFYVPFAFLSYRAAYVAFFVFNSLILAVSIRLLWPSFSPLGEIWRFLPGAIVLCFFPIAMALIEGQDSLILLALFAASLIATEGDKDFLAGIFLGFTLFKFQYALPIAVLLLIWRRWRFVAGFAVSGLAAVGLSVWLTGFTGVTKYLPYLLSMSANFSAADGAQHGIHPEGMSNLRGLVAVVAGGSSPRTFLVTAGLSLVIVACAAFKRPSLPGALLAAILVSYHHVISDASLLVLPMGLLLSKRGLTTLRAKALAILAGVVFLGVPILLFSGAPYCLLVLPLTGILLLSDGIYLSHKPSGQVISRPQKETT